MPKIKLPKYEGEFITDVVSTFIGRALQGKLVSPITEAYCPEEVSEIVNFYLEKAYNKGVSDMQRSMQDLLWDSNSYDANLEYSYGHYKDSLIEEKEDA